MTLLAASKLDPALLFQGEIPPARGSSVDLTVGDIFDDRGRAVDQSFTLKPGHMVTVVSTEVFNLPPNVTGHVTYRTRLTRNGISALTVGIVDPGWDGPVTTTLLNFSNVNHVISKGDVFLRVSFFEHDPVAQNYLVKSDGANKYRKAARSLSAKFPKTFLDREKIISKATNKALAKMGFWATIWIAGVAVAFGTTNWFLNRDTMITASSEFRRMQDKIDQDDAKLRSLEQKIELMEQRSEK